MNGLKAKLAKSKKEQEKSMGELKMHGSHIDEFIDVKRA